MPRILQGFAVHIFWTTGLTQGTKGKEWVRSVKAQAMRQSMGSIRESLMLDGSGFRQRRTGSEYGNIRMVISSLASDTEKGKRCVELREMSAVVLFEPATGGSALDPVVSRGAYHLAGRGLMVVHTKSGDE
jgi:hypothetical protein